jgi:hypothetical protein
LSSKVPPPSSLTVIRRILAEAKLWRAARLFSAGLSSMNGGGLASSSCVCVAFLLS